MGNKLYVGNLPFSTSEEALNEAFGQCGAVSSVKIITDKATGRSKGFAFVEMSTDEEAQKAIDTLNGTELDGRSLKISEARPQEPREGGGRGGFGGGRGGGFDGGRGGGGGFGGGRGGGGDRGGSRRNSY